MVPDPETKTATRLRILFMGTPQLACTCLQALLDSPRFELLGAVTQPDRPKGRELKLLPSPVKELARSRSLAVLQPARARDSEFLESVRAMRPDLITVAAYGQILPESLLQVPRFGCLNVHTSLLPKYRGAAPIQWAILNGDSETGITIMQMDAGLDTGAIVTQASTPILDEDNSQTLHDRLALSGAELLVKTIEDYTTGRVKPCPQPSEGVSYARKILKTDGQIDWKQPARTIFNQVRGLIPWPGAFTYLPAPQSDLLKIWRVEPADVPAPPGEIVTADKTGIVVGCGQRALRILSMQREGGRKLTPEQFLAGRPLRPGQSLGRLP